MKRINRKHSAWMAVLAAAMVFTLIGGMVGVGITRASAEETVGYDVVYSSSNPIPQIAKNIRPSVVQVIQYTQAWNRGSRQVTRQEQGFGSGTYIQEIEDGGYILTNNHVVDGGEALEIVWLDGTTMDAELVGYDSGTDIAVLKFSGKAPEDAKPVALGDSDTLEIGELAIVIGTPASDKLFNTVTAGIISGLDRENMNAGNFSRAVSTIQTDAAINGGNSGGALLNAKGELVGIPTLKLSANGYGNSASIESLGFCIPVNTAKPIIDQLITNGKVVRPRLGVSVQDFDGPDEAIPSYPPAGVQIMKVEEESPAETAGLQPGDVIYAIDGERTRNFNTMTGILDKHVEGDVVTLTIYRYYDDQGKWLGKYTSFDVDVELKILD